jgi:protein kinase C substrate 80K-H
MNGLFLVFIVTLTVLSVSAQGLFDFFKRNSNPTENHPAKASLQQVVDPNFVRGVPAHLQAQYKSPHFTCDNGQMVLDASAVNDGYCDCRDKSDEPGTSACHEGRFVCQNNGYKPVVLSSSRVDDGVCDCCDGSDEGVVAQCPNTCQQASDRERAAVASMLDAYRAGSRLRDQLVASATEQRKADVAQLEPLAATIAGLRGEVQDLEARVSARDSLFRAEQTKVEAALQNEIAGLLELNSPLFSSSSSSPPSVPKVEYLVQLLANLLQAGRVEETTLRTLLPTSVSTGEQSSVSSASSSSSVYSHDNEGESDGDEEEVFSDSYGDDITISLDNHNDNDNEEVSAACEIVTIAQLGLVDQTRARALRFFCDEAVSDQEKVLREAIVKVVHHVRLSAEAMLVLGYHALNRHFVGAAEFARTHLDTHGEQACPSTFVSLTGLCELNDKLTSLIHQLQSVSSLVNEDSELQRLRDEMNSRLSLIREHERNKEKGEQARRDLETHKDHLELLAMKNQCFEVVDGKFSYNLCMLENIRQKEIDGNGNVSLGEFDSVEAFHEGGASYKLHFKNGQYCHAFGPRSADVTVVCGPQNSLKAAREPSTCFYTLVFESPAACTPEYASVNGLTPFL